MTRASAWGALAAGAVVVLAMAAACSDSSKTDQPAAGAGQAGENATSRGGEGGASLGGGAHSSSGEAGAAGEAGATGKGGAAGEMPQCDCGDDPNFVHVPLACARHAGPLPTFAHDLPVYRDNAGDFGLPFYTLLGTCASGYHTLEYGEACENGGKSTYDAAGNLVYSGYGPYGVADPLCGKNDSRFGNFGIGETDPAVDCEYCVLSSHAAPGEGGAGGEAGQSAAATSCYPQVSTYTQCDPEMLK